MGLLKEYQNLLIGIAVVGVLATAFFYFVDLEEEEFFDDRDGERDLVNISRLDAGFGGSRNSRGGAVGDGNRTRN
jgi:hypothetical protein